MRFSAALLLVGFLAVASVFTLFARQPHTSSQEPTAPQEPASPSDAASLDDLAFPTWIAFEELELTVLLIIQTSSLEQRQQMLRVLNATVESAQVPEDRRERVAAIRDRLRPLLERQ